MTQRSVLSYFRVAFICTVVGLGLAGVVGHLTNDGVVKAVVLCAILSVLEISLSFDNAVVNASVLGRMTPRWRKRFLSWGILIAVFGMRLLFPLALVSLIGKMNPLASLKLAANEPETYAALMQSAHLPVSAFGGAFLLMVALRHFFSEHENHWIEVIERRLANVNHLPMADVALALIIVGTIAAFADKPFLAAGLAGIVVFILVDGLSSLLNFEQKNFHRASIGLFIYLEVLDASFSFDGVIGAFAITKNLFLITIGLGVGAFYVRSLTMLMADRGLLKTFVYLESGAFWAILALSTIMFVSVFHEVPELVTGLLGALVIGASVWSSLRQSNRQAPIKPNL